MNIKEINKMCNTDYESVQEFKNQVDWKYISIYQKLSEIFITENKELVNWKYISEFQKLSETFISENSNKLSLDKIADNWNYKSVEFKKQAIINSKLYEYFDEYFIGYKGIRTDRYSDFNFQYQYLTNNTYESHCDSSDNENSFGLSVWTEERAKDYCNQLVIRVKVNYEDVGRMVHGNGKIRCFKITVLN